MERIRRKSPNQAGVWTERLFTPLRHAALAWSVLLTVLVCALAPAGLPHTATQGSAFNPATTSVALHARAPGERLLDGQAIETDTPGPSIQPFPSFVATILPAQLLAERRIATQAAAYYRSAAPARLSTPHAAPWARGPPVA